MEKSVRVKKKKILIRRVENKTYVHTHTHTQRQKESGSSKT